jgi:thymidylate synthase
MAVYQRSCDLFLGLPFDLAGYALLQRLIAKEVGLQSNELTFFIGDAHVYLNHLPQVTEVLKRKPYKAPMLGLRSETSLFGFEPEGARLIDYLAHDAVSAKLNV